VTGARAMAHARWAKIPAAKRRQIMQKVRAHGGGRKRDRDRCYCGAHTWHSATLRGFDCCKRAGSFHESVRPVWPTRRKKNMNFRA
jgi:hypothetical protein